MDGGDFLTSVGFTSNRVESKKNQSDSRLHRPRVGGPKTAWLIESRPDLSPSPFLLAEGEQKRGSGACRGSRSVLLPPAQGRMESLCQAIGTSPTEAKDQHLR